MDLTSYNSYFEERTDSSKELFKRPLTPSSHNDFDVHLIGDALGSPSIINEMGSVGSLGTSPIPAREDHEHGLAPWTNPSYTGLVGTNGYLILSHASDSNVYLRANAVEDGDLELGTNDTADLVLAFSGNHVMTGNLSLSGDLTSDSVYTDNWFRSQGDTGWYSEDWTAGIRCIGDSWIRTYGSASGIYSGTQMGGLLTGTGSTVGFQAMYRSTAFGTFYYFTSSRKLKERIEDLGSVGHIIDQFKPVSFYIKATEEDDEDTVEWKKKDQQFGFIAEDISKIDKGQFGSYDSELNPVAWDLHPVVSLLMAEVQELRKRVKVLENA